MSYQYVNVVTINKVAVIEFNYGRKLNALSKVFIDNIIQKIKKKNKKKKKKKIIKKKKNIGFKSVMI